MARRFAVALTTLGIAGIAIAGVGAQADLPTDAHANEDYASALVSRMRDAPLAHDFGATVVVMWSAGGDRHTGTMEVRNDDGVLEVVAGDAAILHEGDVTALQRDGDWTSLGSEVLSPDLPAADAAWHLRARPGPIVAGRPTTLVVARRDDGGAGLRLALDDDTGLLLRREVLDDTGAAVRSTELRSFVPGDPGPVGTVPAHAATDRAAVAIGSRSIPDGFAAPAAPGGGFALVARWRTDQGIVLLYHDGLFAASVLEQRGALDWDGLPDGGTSIDVAGTTARRYGLASSDVTVWQRGDVVMTCVSDAPPDRVDEMLDGFGRDRGTVDRVVDFVLDPFGWR